MASSIQLLRSTIAQERPFPGNLLEGQPAVNLNTTEPGLFFKAADGSLVKFGPAAITSDGSPPNSSPQGSSGNTVGELWLDKSVNPAVLKVYDGAAWVNAGSGGGGGGGAASFVRWIYTAAGGETSLSGSSGGVLLDYTPGLEEVYVNGVLITRGTDYSATNGTSITNLSALTAGDVITVMSINPVETVQLPGQVTLLRWTVLATSGQTVLSGVDSSGQQLAYTPGFEEVYINGAFLRRGVDYTATDGATITGLSPLTEDDEVTVMSWTPFTIGEQISNEDVADNAEISSTKLKFLRSGLGATSRTVQDKLEDLVSVKDFGAKGDYDDATDTGTDDTAAIQAAVDASGGGIFFPPGNYLVQGQIKLPNYGFYDRTTARTAFGQNARIVVDSTEPIFTGPDVSSATTRWRFRDLTYSGRESSSGNTVFDLDRLYNCVFTHNSFQRLGTVFISKGGKSPSYPDGYIQSVQINNNHFGACSYVVNAKRCFNLSVCNNFFEACGRCVVVDGDGDPAANVLNICFNVMEGAGAAPPIQVGGTFGCVILGNYFEFNPNSLKCDIRLNIPGATTHRGLSITGNQFQPSSAQKSDPDYYSIKIGNAINGSAAPVITGNTTTGPRLVSGAPTQSLVLGNYSTNATSNTFPVPTQSNVIFGGLQSSTINRSSAYDDATNTWKVFTLSNLQRAVYEVDGFLNLSNIGINLVGRTAISMKFWVDIDAQSNYTVGMIGNLFLEEMTGARNSSGATLYSNYWGAVTPAFSFQNGVLTVSFDTFNDYSTPGLGEVYTLRPDISVKSLTGSGSYRRIEAGLP